MPNMPHWLPAIVSVNGVWTEVLARLYGVFEADFKRIRLLFDGRPVWWDRRILPGEAYEEGFWHLITKADLNTSARLLDPRRAERLPWCGPVIANSADGAVTVWDFEEANGHVRTYLWLQEWDYVVVMEKRQQRVSEVAFLITAFHVDGESSRRNLGRKYQSRRP